VIGALLVRAGSATGSVTGLDAEVESTLDLIGVFVFALSGALLAVRKGYELVGVCSLAVVTALGGGIIRDVVLGVTPPTAFEDVLYLVVPLLAAGIVLVAHWLIEERLLHAVLVFDAAGLGVFCVTGAVLAASVDTSAVGAVFLGVITAAGGGVLRDVLAGAQPQVFQADSTLYVIPAALGSTVVVVAWRNGWYSGGVAAGVAIAIFALRLAAMRFGWRAPKPLAPVALRAARRRR
jgi:uncharacterized membrane protein YeiH